MWGGRASRAESDKGQAEEQPGQHIKIHPFEQGIATKAQVEQLVDGNADGRQREQDDHPPGRAGKGQPLYGAFSLKC